MEQFSTQTKIFWRYLKPWWSSEEKVLAWAGLVALLILACLSVAVAWLNNIWTKHCYASLENKDLNTFLYLTALYVPLVIIIGGEGCTREYLSSWLSFRWRRWITKRVQGQWLTDKLYYKTAAPAKDSIDNPDQRISQDIAQSCNKIIELFHIFFRDGLSFFVFASGLWAISIQLKFSIPGLLVWVALLYSVGGFLVTLIIGKNLIVLDRSNEKLEAIFRYKLVRLLEKREEIAMLNGEKFESTKLGETFNNLGRNYYQVLKSKFYINLFNALHLNGRIFLSLAILGPLYFSGAITLALIMQARGMFYQVSTASASLMHKFTEIASLIASLQRLTTFEQLMQKSAKEIKYFSAQDNSSKNVLNISQLRILYPDGRLMWQVPEIKLYAGERKTLMAPSGTGKTTLLRTITGLYSFYQPSPTQHSLLVPQGLKLIPQRPYMPTGTLRECLCYPDAFLEDEIIKVMKQCHLSHLTALLDQEDDYQQLLSLGEQQRINFVRILLHKPKWLVLDEPTSQLNKEYVQSLCALLAQELPETAILAISHHPLPHFEQII